MAGNPQWQILIDEFKPQNSIVVVSSETQNARSATPLSASATTLVLRKVFV